MWSSVADWLVKTNTRRSIARCQCLFCTAPRELNLKWLYFIRPGDGNGRIYVLVMIILCLVVYSFLTPRQCGLLHLSPSLRHCTTHTRTIANLCQFLNSDTSIKPDRWSSLSEFADQAGHHAELFRQQRGSRRGTRNIVIMPYEHCIMYQLQCRRSVASGCSVLVLANYNCNRSRFLASDSHSVHFINAMQPLLKCIFRVINGHNSITITHQPAPHLVFGWTLAGQRVSQTHILQLQDINNTCTPLLNVT